jgi:hypothetical protein
MTNGAKKAAVTGLQDLVASRIEKLRPKLLDLTKRNPLISVNLSPRRNSVVRVIDELPDVLAFHLSQEKKMKFQPLPGLDEDLAADSGRNRPPIPISNRPGIPIQIGHPFRSKSATYSGPKRPLWAA